MILKGILQMRRKEIKNSVIIRGVVTIFADGVFWSCTFFLF